MPDVPPAYDVAIIGGGLAGAATAVLLLQRRPGLRVVLVDRARKAPQSGLGEALPEAAAFFVGRVLGLGAHLNECHYTRQGSRFWFANGDPAQTFDACSEIGSKYLARLPTFLVDRTVLDAELRRRAAELGAEIRRPATARSVMQGKVILESGDEINARRVVDASGGARPANLLWSRWRGVKDWDSAELRRRYPAWAAAAFGMRNPAINYLTGDGWWSGWTPVRGGEVSIRTVWDPRLVEVSGDVKTFLAARHPIAREMLARAEMVEGSAGASEGAAFDAGDGSMRVGGAAGYVDPLYGRHLDWTARTVMAAADAILADRPSRLAAPATARDNCQYIGEFDLMRVAYLGELGHYTLRVARAPYREGAGRLAEPPPESPLLALLNRRCVRMAQVRRARGLLGRSNSGRRALFTSFNLNLASGRPLVGAALRWAWLEITEGWRKS